HQPGRRAAGSLAARAAPPGARHRGPARAHRLHAVRRLADPRLRAPLHQVPRAVERTRHRERGQGGGQGGARPRAARDRRRAGGGTMRLGRVRPGATPASAAPLLCRWDLDKTYLRSEFDSLRSLLRTAFERAEAKVAVPGVAELLRGRLAAPPGAPELLFGDDWELDSLIYSLYADVVAGRLPPARLAPILRRIRVDPRLLDEILALAGRAAGGARVARIFINLERRSPPATFRLFGPRVVPTFNYFQTA